MYETRFEGNEELARRWSALGFVRKSKVHFARVGATGLELITAPPPRSSCNSLGVSFAVWLAPLAARESGKVVRWPAARFAWPADKARHASVALCSLADGAHFVMDMDGERGRAGVEVLWRFWPAAEAWLQRHRELRGLAEASAQEASPTSSRRHQIAALCYLELGEPHRAEEMMRRAWHDRCALESPWASATDRAAMWSEEARWWHDVAGLAPPHFDGAPRARGWTAPRPTPPRPRDSFWYASPRGSAWMKTREPAVALERAAALLRFTTFTTWDLVKLRIEQRPSPALVAIEAATCAAWPEDRYFTADELAAAGVEIDPILAEALARFGPAQFHRWATVCSRGWDGWYSNFFWARTAVATPDDLRQFCIAHRDVSIDERPVVALELSADGLLLRANAGGELLPHQGPENYPPHDNAPSWPIDASMRLTLPDCRMNLRARLPFSKDDARLRRYLGKLSEAVGYPLSRSHLRALVVNKAGTRAYDRKLAP